MGLRKSTLEVRLAPSYRFDERVGLGALWGLARGGAGRRACGLRQLRLWVIQVRVHVCRCEKSS